jgi:hypothetical protein
MKLSNLADAPLNPEESIALRRRSFDSLASENDDRDDFSDVSEEFGQSNAMVDGGKEAWKTLFAAWLIDFMTSGRQIPHPVYSRISLTSFSRLSIYWSLPSFLPYQPFLQRLPQRPRPSRYNSEWYCMACYSTHQCPRTSLPLAPERDTNLWMVAVSVSTCCSLVRNTSLAFTAVSGLLLWSCLGHILESLAGHGE